MIDINDIRNKMHNCQITQEDLANALGMKQQSVNAWFIRDRIPRKHHEPIMVALSELCSETLLETQDIPIYNKSSDSIDIKFFDMSLSAGASFDLDLVEDIKYKKLVIDKSLVPQHIESDSLIAIKVDDKSMIPTLLPNETVVYKEDISRYFGDALYAVNFGGMLMVKRIQYNPELNKYDIISDNPQFKSYSVDTSDKQSSFTIIGKVIATIQK